MNSIDFKAAFDALPAPAIIVDAALNCVAVNALFLHGAQCTAKDLLGRNPLDALPHLTAQKERFENAYARALAGEHGVQLRAGMARAQGAEDGGDAMAWWRCVLSPVRDFEGEVVGVVQQCFDVTNEVHGEQVNDIVSDELDHRVRNNLAIVSTMGRRTAHEATSFADFLKVFEARLDAMARTHTLLSDASWSPVPLRRLFETELDPHRDLLGERIALRGAPLRVSPRDAQALALAIHELVSNALRHGALSTPDGRVDVRWARREDGGYSIEWLESGLTDLRAPERLSFGMALVTRIMPAQIGATSKLDFLPNGLRCRIEALGPPSTE